MNVRSLYTTQYLNSVHKVTSYSKAGSKSKSLRNDTISSSPCGESFHIIKTVFQLSSVGQLWHLSLTVFQQSNRNIHLSGAVAVIFTLFDICSFMVPAVC